MVIKKRKAQKAEKKEELLPNTWYPNSVMDWCMSETKKQKQKNCGINIGLFVSCDQKQKFFELKNKIKKDESFSLAFSRRIIQV